MSFRSTTNYGGQDLPSSVWTKMDYLEREPKGHKPNSSPVPVSKPQGQDIGKPTNPRKNKQLQDELKKDLKKRNIR